MRLYPGIRFSVGQPGCELLIPVGFRSIMRANFLANEKPLVIWIGRIRQRDQIGASVSLLLHEKLVAEWTLPLSNRTFPSRQNGEGIIGSKDNLLTHISQLLRSHLPYIDRFGRLGSVS